MDSGRIDLAQLSGSDPKRMASLAGTFDIEVLNPDSVVQMHWTEAWEGNCDAVMVHMPLDAFSGSSTTGRGRKIACTRLRTSLKRLGATKDHFCLSDNGLKLFSVLPCPRYRHASILRIHERIACDQPWNARSAQVRVGGYGRILGICNGCLILVNQLERTVQVVPLASPAFRAQQTFRLLTDDQMAAVSSALQVDEPDLQFCLAGGMVFLIGDRGFVSGDSVAIPANGKGPRFVDLLRVARGMQTPVKSGKRKRLSFVNALHEPASITEDDATWLWFGDDPDPHEVCVRLTDFDSGLLSTHTQPLVMTASPKDDFLEPNYDEDDFDDRDTRHVLVIYPEDHRVELFDTYPAGYVHFAAGPRDMLRINGQVIIAFQDVERFVQVFVDSGSGAAYRLPVGAVTVILGRWSNYLHASKPTCSRVRWILFPTSAFADGRREWYAVQAKERSADWSSSASAARDESVLYKVLATSMPRGVYDEGYFTGSTPNGVHVEWEQLRLFPNWLVDHHGAIYIGGLKRLLAFLATPEGRM